MSICCIQKHSSQVGGIASRPGRSIILLSLLATVWFAAGAASIAAESDEIYLKIYNLIEQADNLVDKARPAEAKTKYLEAQTQLREFKQTFPTYNAKTVNYRLNYLSGKIDTLSRPAPGTEENHSPQNTSAAAKRPAAGEPEIKLLEAGAEPRQVFRLHAKPMEIQKAKISAKVGMNLSVGGQPGQMMKLPEMVITATMTTKSVSPDGEIAYTMVFDDINAVSKPGETLEMATAMKASLAGMKGMTVTGVMNDRYYTRKIEVQIPPNADAQTRAGMEQMKDSFANTRFILPEEALGLGGKWEVKQKARKQGMMIEELVRHEVVSIEGDTLVVKSSTTQSAANQKIPNPIMTTMKVDLVKMTGTMTETVTIDLNKTLPVKASASEQSEISMNMANAGKKQAMVVKSETESTLDAQ